jgi:hypothetical protein
MRDDIVTRFSPQSLASLHEELRTFDVDAAKQARTFAEHPLLTCMGGGFQEAAPVILIQRRVH